MEIGSRAQHSSSHLFPVTNSGYCTDTHSTIKFYACNPSVTTREGTFMLTPICTEKDKQNLSHRLAEKLTQSELYWVCSASRHTPKQKRLPPKTSQSLTLRSMPPVASNREPGLNCTAFTSPSCASWGVRGTEQPPKNEISTDPKTSQIRKL